MHLATVMEISKLFCATLNSSLSKDVNVSCQNTGDMHLVTVYCAGVSGPFISPGNWLVVLSSANLNSHCNLH